MKKLYTALCALTLVSMPVASQGPLPPPVPTSYEELAAEICAPGLHDMSSIMMQRLVMDDKRSQTQDILTETDVEAGHRTIFTVEKKDGTCTLARMEFSEFKEGECRIARTWYGNTKEERQAMMGSYVLSLGILQGLEEINLQLRGIK